MTNEKKQAFSLKQLLSNDKYIIPIYQRNYSWGKTEISQLIRDIKEFFATNPDKNYYIGSLVCFKRENGDFELIDGQQRHTTISLINAFLKSSNVNDTVSSTNLKFDSRKNVQRFLEELYSSSDFDKFIEASTISGTQNFIDAIGFIREEFNVKDENANPFNIESFAKNFYGKVKFFRVEVPQDTDLNHYFEIMNNRGEQLEKHEIVKALLMGKIQNENEDMQRKEQDKFAKIWDICSDMSNYVYFNFDKNIRETIFDKGNLKASSFDELDFNLNNDNDESNLLEILKDNQQSKDFSQDEKDEAKEKYKSVIDFPNFLLQVLKLDKEEIALDDKNLLKAFKNEIDPKEFIFNLLKYRTIFDKYIIKQDLSDSDEEKQNWGIRKLNANFDEVEKTYEKSDEENDDKLIKLQTMLYYSNPSNTNNNWVQKILKEKYFELEVTDFSDRVFSEIAKPRFDRANLSYPDITAYNLYFIDFLLWKFWKEKKIEYKGIKKPNANKELNRDEDELINNLTTRIYNIIKKEDKEDYKNLFSTFKFKQLNSKEHLLPQSKATESEKEVLNNLGNLCLISTSQNSSANDKHPLYKKEQFRNDNSSLKRLIMFESFENEKWSTDQINDHQEEIKELIKQGLIEKNQNHE